jgi:hypothetical protein
MAEIKFGKHTLEIIVQSVDFPGILENAFDTATITIGDVIFVGEITNISAKKIKDKDTDEIEVWATVKLEVDAVGAMSECMISHPGKNYEITDNVNLAYTGFATKSDNSDIIEKIDKKLNKSDFQF